MNERPYELLTTLESKYLEFEKHHEPEKKTIFVFVKAKSSGKNLAEIKWYRQWRQYTFFPMPDTVWNKDCLTDIQKFIEALMAKRKGMK